MSKEYWTIREVVEIFQVEESFLHALEDEDLVCPICEEDSRSRLFSARDLENLRIAKILVEDMGVNLPGVEVILRMRRNVLQIRRQFDAILEDLARQLQDRYEKQI